MNIHVIFYAYALAEPLLDTFAAADAPSLTWHLFRHSDRPPVVAACDELARHANVHYYPYGYSRGLARSCNEGILNALHDGADVVCQLCDDMFAAPGALVRLAEQVLDTPNTAAVEGYAYVEYSRAWRSAGFDAVAFHPAALASIGLFDENCCPINYEDMDWKRRAALSGWRVTTCHEAQFTHRDLNEPHNTPSFLDHFYKTRAYYIAKWGGDLEHETFTRPFDDPRYDLSIPVDQCRNPYPDYQRKDLPE